MAPKRNRFKYLENPIDFNRKWMDGILKSGDAVIDATCGNGQDSIYIAERIGEAGTLYCFDVQEDAIKKTKESLLNLTTKPTLQIFQESHEDLGLFVKSNVDCVFYNLGYLPTSNKSITTKADTTIKSLLSAFKLLKQNGIISLMSYLDHDNREEYEQLKLFLLNLDRNIYNVAETNFILRKSSPVLFTIEKL